MKSRYATRCSACSKPIDVGDEIDRATAGGAWVHAACVSTSGELDLGMAAPARRAAAKKAAPAKKAARAAKPGMVEPAGARLVYTDGACSGNPGPGGWAWAINAEECASGGAPSTTNQRMEVQAAYEAVRALSGPLVVVSDSTYVVNCFKDGWWRGWISRGWTNAAKQPVANRDLWEPFVELVRDRPADQPLAFRWVKGHSGDPMNDLVDQLAVAERLVFAR